MNPAMIRAELEQMREEARPKFPWQEEATETTGFRPEETTGRDAWDISAPPPSVTPGANNATELLPVPLPFEEDPDAPKTDIDALFEERR